MTPCPVCHGKGQTVGYACPGFIEMQFDCRTCAGAGHITAEQTARIERGVAERAMRFARGESQRDAAKRWGVDVAVYSRMENGLMPFPDEALP